jgi:hypothetical protein
MVKSSLTLNCKYSTFFTFPRKGTNRVSISSSPSKKAMSQASSDLEGHGVPLSDEETVFGHFDIFCSRLKQILDVINTVAQFHKYVMPSSVVVLTS